jgi:hypothetical protein
MKKCTKCGEQKPLSEFNKNKSKKDGLGTECKPCAKQNLKKWLSQNPEKQKANKRKWYKNNWEKARKQSKNWRQNNPDRYRAHMTTSKLKKYNLTLESFEEKKLSQNNKCEICREPLGRGFEVHIDHCHKTNNVRGILCIHCNTLLGRAKDSPNILKSALNYLEKYNSKGGQKST